MQHELLRMSLRGEMEEMTAESELQALKDQLCFNQQAIEVITKWHDDYISTRMKATPIEPGVRSGSVLYCRDRCHKHALTCDITDQDKDIREVLVARRDLVDK